MNSQLVSRRWGWIILLGCLASPAAAESHDPASLPLWEAGVLGGGAYIPDYPASDQHHVRGLATPYLVYRGNILRADREGARARFVRTSWFYGELSFAGSFPASSKRNRARQDMPDLDWLGEVGPRLTIPLWRAWGYTPLKIFIPARAVFSSDFANLKHRGYTLTPSLYLRLDDVVRPDWIFVAQLSSNFADRQFNGYFYDVAPAFARPDRPFYDARTGYMGSDVFSGVIMRLSQRFRLFVGGQLAVHEASANQDSPLFRRRLNGTAVLGAAWTITKSRHHAKAPE